MAEGFLVQCNAAMYSAFMYRECFFSVVYYRVFCFQVFGYGTFLFCGVLQGIFNELLMLILGNFQMCVEE